MAAVAQVVADGVAGEKSSHKFRQPHHSAGEQDMGVIAHQGPGKHGCAAGPGDLTQPAHEISPILVVIDDIALFDTADHHMVEGSRTI